MGAAAKRRVNIFEACDRAAAMLLAAGFEFRYQSNITETRYYGWPGREQNLRVSAHKSKRGPIGMPQTVAKITFYDGSCETPGHVAISDEHFEHVVAVAIGLYIMKSSGPAVSSYHGKRGTWGNGGTVVEHGTHSR